MAVKIQTRRGTAAEWTAANPILADGEVGYERDTRLHKVGDGVTAWNSLLYSTTHVRVPALAGGGPNIVGNPTTNSIRSDVHTSTIAGGGGLAGAENVIGSVAGTEASYSTIGGGYDNKNDGVASTIAGGAHHRITPAGGVGSGHHGTIAGGSYNTIATNFDYNTIGGGTQNQITTGGADATIAGGKSNSASAAGAAVAGGVQNQATASYTLVSGYRAKASIAGARAHASGYFSAVGDAQAIDVPFIKETSDATPGSMASSFQFLNLPDNTTWVFDALVVARNTGADEHAAYRLTGAIKRNAGAATTALLGSVTKTVIHETVAGWDVNATAHANGDLRFTVTGEAGKTIRWVGHVRIASVTQ